MGIRKARHQNLALLAKLGWKIISKEDSLWVSFSGINIFITIPYFLGLARNLPLLCGEVLLKPILSLRNELNGKLEMGR